MSGFCIYQDPKYVSGSEHDKVLNNPGFWIYEGFEDVYDYHLPGFWIY